LISESKDSITNISQKKEVIYKCGFGDNFKLLYLAMISKSGEGTKSTSTRNMYCVLALLKERTYRTEYLTIFPRAQVGYE